MGPRADSLVHGCKLKNAAVCEALQTTVPRRSRNDGADCLYDIDNFYWKDNST